VPDANMRAKWSRVRVGDVISRVIDRRANPVSDGLKRYVGVDDLDSDQLKLRRWGEVSDGQLPPTFRYAFPAGSILFPTRRPRLRKCAVAPFAGITGEKILVLQSLDPFRLDPDFMPFLLAHEEVRTWVVDRAIGSVTPHFRWRDLASYEFSLPPLEEQRRIAAALNAMDKAGERLSDAERRLREVRTSHLNNFFEPRFRSGVPLTSVARVVAGCTPSKADQTLWGGGLPWASAKDLKTRHLKDTEDTLTEKGWNLATVAPKGAMLIVVRGMILAHTFPVTQCEQQTAFNQDLRAIIAGEQLEPGYLLLWMEWAARWFLRCTAASSHGTKRIEGHVFNHALVPITSRREQARIVVEHATIIDADAGLRLRMSSHQALRESFMKSVLESPR
jgi:type I restriction enzyme, S subunit